MDENKILNETLKIYENESIENAYEYLQSKKLQIIKPTSQFYNFLYCLASAAFDKDNAIKYLEEAIIQKGMWYRPEVFLDEDLDNIRDTSKFKELVQISKSRYEEAFKKSLTVFTWRKVENQDLAIALHGNQQSLQDSESKWQFLTKLFQVEYIQSKELDSYGLYRWSDLGDGYIQLADAIRSVKLDNYNKKILAGFSSGCNVILNTILNYDFNFDSIILQSPWIPMIDQYLEDIVKIIKAKEINVLIICGDLDDDCFPLSKKFFNELKKKNCKVKKHWIANLSHDFPSNYQDLVFDFIK